MPDTNTVAPDPSSPVQSIPSDYSAAGPRPGQALCLSGGGYRAMVFHLGVLIRLNEAGLLGKLKRISSVSGGSITAGTLGLNWKYLKFAGGIAQNLGPVVIDPVRAMASKTIDAEAILGGIFLPGTISDRIEKAYDKVL